MDARISRVLIAILTILPKTRSFEVLHRVQNVVISGARLRASPIPANLAQYDRLVSSNLA